MKNLQNTILAMVMITGVIFTACEEEEKEADKPYTGSWETTIYPSMSLQGDTIVEKMEFTFTNNTFEDLVYQGPVPDSIALALGIKGAVNSPAENELNVEINEISLQGGPYIDKSSDPESFDNTFGATMGSRMYEQFDAEYHVDGESMMLILPILIQGTEVIDTIHLTKQQ